MRVRTSASRPTSGVNDLGSTTLACLDPLSLRSDLDDSPLAAFPGGRSTGPNARLLASVRSSPLTKSRLRAKSPAD